MACFPLEYFELMCCCMSACAYWLGWCGFDDILVLIIVDRIEVFLQMLCKIVGSQGSYVGSGDN